LRGFAPIGANNPTSIRLRADEMIESDECRLMAQSDGSHIDRQRSLSERSGHAATGA
jgi:hypothetical protein